jgi:hypothetical protein
MTSMIRMMVILMVTLFSLFFISEPSFAQIYNWQDEKGTINFSNDPGTIKFSIEPETPASKKADKAERDNILSDRPSREKSVIMLAQREYIILDGKKYELSPGPRYYDAHPEEKAMDDAIQANKPLVDMQEKLIEDIRMRQQGYDVQKWYGPDGYIELKDGNLYTPKGIYYASSKNKWSGPGGYITLSGGNLFIPGGGIYYPSN